MYFRRDKRKFYSRPGGLHIRGSFENAKTHATRLCMMSILGREKARSSYLSHSPHPHLPPPSSPQPVLHTPLSHRQFSLLLGWCALEARHSDALPDERTAAAGFIGGSTGGAGGGGPARGGVAAGCVGTVGSAAVGRAVNPLEALFDRLRASLGNQKMGQLLGDA
jgi:hypothetical protein